MKDIVIGRSSSDREKLEDKGTVFLGKHYVKMGQSNSLSNNVKLDVARSHVVFVCGKRGGGKCLTEDNYVTLGDGSRKKISELEMDDNPVMSLDQDLKIKTREKDSFYKRQVSSTLRITLATGKQLRCTLDHPLLSYYGWEEAQDLGIGTRIATPKKLPVFGEYDLSEAEVKNIAYDLTTRNIKEDDELKKEVSSPNGKKLKVPSKIYKAPKNKVALFLNRYLSVQGLLRENPWRLEVEATKNVLKEIQHLLLRFGVVSNLEKSKSYKLTITEEFLKTYLQEIGIHGLQREKQEKALRETPVSKNQEVELEEELIEFFDPLDWEALGKKFVKEQSEHGYKENATRTQQNQFLEAIHKSDIYWDEVVKVERIDKPIYVYDFTVPGTNNFVANEVIVHNSYTMGVLAEGMSDLPENIRQNLSIVLVDTMGVYWTMKYPNKQDSKLLREWDIDPKELDVKIFTPEGYHKDFEEKGIPTDKPFSIKPSELSGNDWNNTFSIKYSDPVGVLIERTIHELKEKGKDYDVEDIIKTLESDKDSEKHVVNAAKNHFLNAKNWGIFSKDATKLSDIVAPGQVTVLDISCYATMPGSWNIKNLVTGLISENLFVQRMAARKEEEFKDVHKAVNPYSDDDNQKQDYPMVWLVLDEAHEFLPNEGKTLATDPLVTILREGRQPGISLVLASQQPGKIHTDVMTQADTVIAHRITAKIDTEALGTLMQSYMRKGLVEELDNLPREKGAAIVFDDTNEKMYPIRIRPRFTWHGGSAPTAIRDD